jgi:geranylgeranyl reductase family protein
MRRFDIGVIGAGPAGCRAAWRLARAGARVALFDGSHPREKPCGGGITGRALDIIRDAVDIEQMEAAVIQSATFEHCADTVRVDFRNGLPDAPQLIVASRERFDAALLSAAREAGAVHINARVIDVARDGADWTITARDGPAKARWVLGADGVNSLVRRRVSRPFVRADLSLATGFFVHGVSSTDIAIAFEDAPAGYLWSFPRRDHLAVGVCAQADDASTAALIPRASEWIRSNVAGACRLERYSWPIPSLRESAARREHPAGPGWMLLGDAGGMADPITREGIFFALLSAEHAADSLLETGSDPARQYGERLRATVFAELVRAASLKTRFFHPRFTRLLLQALQRSAAIRAIMIDLVAGRQAYRGLRRRLLRTFELRLMVEMLSR